MSMSFYRYSNRSSNYQRPSLFGGFRFFPPVIRYLLVANIGMFLVTGFFGLFRLGGVPLAESLYEFLPLRPIGDGFRVWQLVTYMFMHGGLMHLLFNMFALWMFGMELENVWGSKKFLLYYMVCGLGAGLSNLVVAPLFGQAGPTVGASGAIYGILIAFGMMFPDRPIFVYFLLPIRARYFVLLYIALELYSGVTGTTDGIAHFAHLGGAAVGAAYLLVEQRRNPFRGMFSRARARVIPHQHANSYSATYADHEVSDAKFYDVRDHREAVTQAQIDEILDKISQSGYQSLTEEEKKLLFEASKKLN
jgi:membrane associated rhomboid family serine protease